MMVINPQLYKIQNKKLGLLIAEARKTASRSLHECAGATGLDEAQFQAIETGERAITFPELQLLAYYLDIPLKNILEEKVFALKPRHIATEKLPVIHKLQNSIIGLLIHDAREKKGISLEEFSKSVAVSPENIDQIEQGLQAVPLPELMAIAGALDLRLEDFAFKDGQVAAWEKKTRSAEQLQDLPENLQEFLSKPVNRPYLELAVKLSEMPVNRLRTIAESLLDITY